MMHSWKRATIDPGGGSDRAAKRDCVGWRWQMTNTDKRKQSLYFPEDMLKEIQDEAGRLDRSLSWIVQQCWKRARRAIREFPSSNDEAEDSLPDPREEK